MVATHGAPKASRQVVPSLVEVEAPAEVMGEELKPERGLVSTNIVVATERPDCAAGVLAKTGSP